MKCLLPVILLFACTANAQVKEHVPRQPYIKYVDSALTYYISEFDQDTTLPLIIFIQGSGYGSLFTKTPSGSIAPNYGHINLPYLAKGKAKVLIVEKPGVDYLNNFETPNPNFDLAFSLDYWAEYIVRAIRLAIATQHIDKSKMLVIGHSEGGLVAARVTSMMPGKISHVAILAGEGPSQLYSLNKFAEDSTFFYTPGSKTRPVDSLQTIWKNIQADPTSVTKKFWGFTYKRWSSFLQTSVIEQLQPFKGKISITQGTADKNVYPQSAQILYTSLLSNGKDVRLLMVPGADHSFRANGKDLWDDVLSKTMSWFLQ